MDSSFTIAGIDVKDVLQPKSRYIDELRRPRERRPSIATTITSGSTQTFIESIHGPLPPLPLATLKPTLKSHQNPESAVAVFLRASELSRRLRDHIEERERLEAQCPVSPITEERPPVSPLSPVGQLEQAAKKAAAKANAKTEQKQRPISGLPAGETPEPLSRAVSPMEPEVEASPSKSTGKRASAMPAPLNPKKSSNSLLPGKTAPTSRAKSPLAAPSKPVSRSAFPLIATSVSDKSTKPSATSRSASTKIHISQLAKQAKAQQKANKAAASVTKTTNASSRAIRSPSPGALAHSSTGSLTLLNKSPTPDSGALMEKIDALKPRILSPNTNTVVTKDPLVKPLLRLSAWLSKSIAAAQVGMAQQSDNDSENDLPRPKIHHESAHETSAASSKMYLYSLADEKEIVGLRLKARDASRKMGSGATTASAKANQKRASVSTYVSAAETVASARRPSSDIGGDEKFPMTASLSAVGVAM